MSTAQTQPIEQYVIDVARRKRLDRGWTQIHLASLLEISSGFIGDVESAKNRAKYNLNHINKLAEIFQCSPKDFLPERHL